MGFFPSETWTRKALATVPNCGPCGVHKTSPNPKVAVQGRGRAGILVIGEHPDRLQLGYDRGSPNHAMSLALASAGVNMTEDCWLTWATICATPEAPTDEQLVHCRPALQRVIEELQPRIIIPFGAYAVKSLLTPIWRDDQGYSIQRWAGWQIPCHKPNAWICPTHHPAFGGDKNADLVAMFTSRHLRAAVGLSGRPWGTVPDWSKEVDVELDPSRAAGKIREAFLVYGMADPVAVDIETNMLKPDSDEAFIFSCALSNGAYTVSYPWTKATAEATREVIHSGRPFIASNMKFEERWFLKEFGSGVDHWHRDTMIRAHWEDCRGGKGDGGEGGGSDEKHEAGITGLKFQAFVKLGQPAYNDSIAHYLKSEGGGNTPNRIKQAPLRELLLYGGMDALLERKLVP